jgi:hypothetical protein
MNRVDKQERTQRIRYGLTGLAVVFLFVLLGTAISNSADEPADLGQANIVAPAEPNEPLAEIGAAPNSASASNEIGVQEPAKSPESR